MAKIIDINFKDNNNWKQLLDLIYPIGSIYTSVNSTSPATLFGGTWQQLKDRFLICANNTYTAGSTGGAATVTLTAAQTALKAHSHIMNHGHENDFSFSVAKHSATNCTRSTDASVTNSHAAVSITTPSTNCSVSVTAHTVSTQPVFKYTPCAAHTHSLSSGYAYLTSQNGYNFPYRTKQASWTPNWWVGTGVTDTGGGTTYGSGTTLTGNSGSTNHTGTANGTTGSLTTNCGVSAHSVTVTQPAYSTPALSHSITQPTFNIPKLTHSTPTKSGGITDYSGDTGTLTEADGAPHNNMPPYLVVYMWERIADPCQHTNISPLVETYWCIGEDSYNSGREDEQHMYICQDCGAIKVIDGHGCNECDSVEDEAIWTNNLNQWVRPDIFISDYVLDPTYTQYYSD